MIECTLNHVQSENYFVQDVTSSDSNYLFVGKKMVNTYTHCCMVASKHWVRISNTSESDNGTIFHSATYQYKLTTNNVILYIKRNGQNENEMSCTISSRRYDHSKWTLLPLKVNEGAIVQP